TEPAGPADLVLQASVALVGKTGQADPLDDIVERLKLAAYMDDLVVLEPRPELH
nr:hypothetical protein [Tanacetum cinerariifolium]